MAKRWQGQGGRGQPSKRGRWSGGGSGNHWDDIPPPGPGHFGPPGGGFHEPGHGPPPPPPPFLGGGGSRFRIQPKNDEEMLRILLRASDAGAIIGKSGSNVRELRSKHKCQIHLPESGDSSERLLIITGKQENIVEAMRAILDHIREPEDTPYEKKPGSKEVQILVPEQFMGVIIGRGGTKIRELRSKVEAVIKIFREALPFSTERSISVHGPEDKICQVITYILDELSASKVKHEDRGRVVYYDPMHGVDMPPPEMVIPPSQHSPRGRGGQHHGAGGRGGGSFRGPQGRPGGQGGPHQGPPGNQGGPHQGPPGGPHQGPPGAQGGPHQGPLGSQGGPHQGPLGSQGGPHQGPLGSQGGPHQGPPGGQGGPHQGPPGGPHQGPLGGHHQGGPGGDFGNFSGQHQGGGKWRNSSSKGDRRNERANDGDSHPMTGQPPSMSRTPVQQGGGGPYNPPHNVQPPSALPQAQPLMPPVPPVMQQPQQTQPVMQMPPPQAPMPQQQQGAMFPVYGSNSTYGGTPQQTVPSPQTNMGYNQQPPTGGSAPQSQQSNSTKFSIPLQFRNSIMNSLPVVCAQTKCLIHVEEPQQGGDSCIITITGQQENISMATTLLQNSVRQYHNV